MKSLNKLKEKVEHKFGIEIKKMKIIKQTKNGNFVAEIITDRDNRYILKGLNVNEKRQDFITRSEKQLKQKGIKLAVPIATKKGEPFFTSKNVPYVLYEWVEGKRHPLNNQADFKQLIKTVAKFHRASNGLKYPAHTKIYDQSNWGDDYKRQLKHLKKFYQANRNTADPGKREFVKAIPHFQKIGIKARYHLKKSRYKSIANLPYTNKTLIHGDAHQGNILQHDQSARIIDLEDIRYDLPSKDLLRIFGKYTKRHGFKSKMFEKMMMWYEKIHPLSLKLRQLVLVDCLFPHTFSRMLRLKKYKVFTQKELKRLIKYEKKKADYIYSAYFEENLAFAKPWRRRPN
jgi:CotS family spore coat protein